MITRDELNELMWEQDDTFGPNGDRWDYRVTVDGETYYSDTTVADEDVPTVSKRLDWAAIYDHDNTNFLQALDELQEQVEKETGTEMGWGEIEGLMKGQADAFAADGDGWWRYGVTVNGEMYYSTKIADEDVPRQSDGVDWDAVYSPDNEDYQEALSELLEQINAEGEGDDCDDLYNPDPDPQWLVDIADTPSDIYSLREAAAHMYMPADTLSKLAHHRDEYVRIGVAGNTSTDPENLYYLADDGSDLVRRAAEKNPNTPPRDAYDEENWEERCERAEPTESADELATLACDPHPKVREATTRNWKGLLQAETLAKLAGDTWWPLRRYAAGNSRTPPERLAELTKDPYREVRAAAAGNHATPLDAIIHLKNDVSGYVRYRATEEIKIRQKKEEQK